jgi:hypothetical protein
MQWIAVHELQQFPSTTDASFYPMMFVLDGPHNCRARSYGQFLFVSKQGEQNSIANEQECALFLETRDCFESSLILLVDALYKIDKSRKQKKYHTTLWVYPVRIGLYYRRGS